jgi:hypothetical protein
MMTSNGLHTGSSSPSLRSLSLLSMNLLTFLVAGVRDCGRLCDRLHPHVLSPQGRVFALSLASARSSIFLAVYR